MPVVHPRQEHDIIRAYYTNTDGKRISRQFTFKNVYIGETWKKLRELLKFEDYDLILIDRYDTYYNWQFIETWVVHPSTDTNGSDSGAATESVDIERRT